MCETDYIDITAEQLQQRSCLSIHWSRHHFYKKKNILFVV